MDGKQQEIDSRVIMESMNRERHFKKFAEVVKAANRMADAAQEARVVQSEFLEGIGMSWEEARALTPSRQLDLQQRYRGWLADRETQPALRP